VIAGRETKRIGTPSFRYPRRAAEANHEYRRLSEHGSPPIEAIVDLAGYEVGTATMGCNGHQISKRAPCWVSIITAKASGSSNAAEI
jgi:hypothetical protein